MNTLLVDDQETLVTTLEGLAEQQGHQHVNFFTSLNDAREAAEREQFDRYIADYVFEGEEGNGLSFLEEVSDRSPEAELFLLTGKPLNEQTEERLKRIGGNLIHKSALDSRLVAKLFSKEPLTGGIAKEREDIDIGELRLKVERLETDLRDRDDLTNLLIEDIIGELEQIKDQRKVALLIGDRMLSAESLIGEVKNKTPIGRELIRLHHELFRRLRSGQ